MDVHGESRMNAFLSFVSFKPYTLTSFLNFNKLGPNIVNQIGPKNI